MPCSRGSARGRGSVAGLPLLRGGEGLTAEVLPVSLQTPTLIIYGERDSGLGAQSLQSLQQLPKHKVVVLPDAGHACYLEKPREFHEVLLAFLGELQ